MAIPAQPSEAQSSQLATQRQALGARGPSHLMVDQLGQALRFRVQRRSHAQKIGRAVELAPSGQLFLEEGCAPRQRRRAHGRQLPVHIHVDLQRTPANHRQR